MYRAVLPRPGGTFVTRRVAVVSRAAINRHLKPIVADITTTVRERRLPTYVEVEPTTANGLDKTSFIVCHELATVELATLEERLGRLDITVVFAMREALAIAIGAKELPPLP